MKDPPREIADLADFLRDRYGRLLDFGKCYGRFYAQVMSEDPGYCSWALGRAQPSAGLAGFKKFVRHAWRSSADSDSDSPGRLGVTLGLRAPPGMQRARRAVGRML